MVLSTSFGVASGAYAMLPLILAAFGIVVSIAGTFLVRTREGGNPQTALNTGTFGAGALMIVVSWFVIQRVIGGHTEGPGASAVFFATIAGLRCSIIACANTGVTRLPRSSRLARWEPRLPCVMWRA